MPNNSIHDEVISIIAERFNLEPHGIHENQRIMDDLGADSLDIINIVIDLEEKYDLDITDDVIAKLQTVGQVCSWIEACVLVKNP